MQKKPRSYPALVDQDHVDVEAASPRRGGRRKSVSDFTDEQLLAELIRRNETQPGPRSMIFVSRVPPRVATVRIGADHHAEIVIGEEDLAMLQGRIG